MQMNLDSRVLSFLRRTLTKEERNEVLNDFLKVAEGYDWESFFYKNERVHNAFKILYRTAIGEYDEELMKYEIERHYNEFNIRMVGFGTFEWDDVSKTSIELKNI